MKITFIGAGSIGFTRKLLSDLLAVKAFADTEVAFTDINGRNLDMVTRLCQRDIEANGLSVKIKPTTDRREALKGADYVINCVRVGGLDAFRTDIEIPLTYGVDQAIGDTLCAGGIMYAQRGIPAVLDFCKDIREVAAPGCLLLNYSNPNAMLTWACVRYGGVRTIGLCHGVQHGHGQIAGALGADKKDVDIVCVGINHMTWYTGVKNKGVPVSGAEILAAFEKDEHLSRTEVARIDVLRRTGYYCTETNGHLPEYMPYYRKRPEDLHKWIDLSGAYNGETGGYLRECIEQRNWFDTDFPNWMKGEPRKYAEERRSFEHGSFIIESLETGRPYRGHFNVANDGCISNLPADCIVEVPCYVDYNGLSVPRVGDLPLVCAALCQSNISVQRLAVEAAVHGDVNLLKQAMMMDPLVGAVCDTNEIWQMTDELLIAQEQWLPQFKDAIPGVKADWDQAEKAGTLVKGRATTGIRQRVKSVEEVIAERDAWVKWAQEQEKKKAKA